jgi:hypothetical protein
MENRNITFKHSELEVLEGVASSDYKRRETKKKEEEVSSGKS